MSQIISSGYSNTRHPITATTTNSLIVTFPREILTLILSRLKDSGIVHFAETCKHTYYLLTHVPLWEPRLRNYFPDSYANLKSLDEAPSLYKRLRIADYNIKKGKYNLSCFFGHKGEITVLVRSGNLLLSGSRDGTIKIWDDKSRQELYTLKGHKGTVTNILIYEGMIISGSADNTVKVWNLEDGKLLQTFERFEGRANSLAVYGDNLIAGPCYGTLRIWDLKSGQRLPALIGSQKEIRCITISGDQLFSGSSDGTIAIWDLKTKKETILTTGLTYIACVVVHNGKLISRSNHLYNGEIEIRDLKSGEIKRLKVSGSSCDMVTNLGVCDGKLFAASGGKSINIYDLEAQKQHLLTLVKIHLGSILFCNGQLMVNLSSAWEGRGAINILDFSDPSLLTPALPLFLANLGIVTEEICLEKLNCSSDFLSKIGICSSADVEALGLFYSPDLHNLEIAPEETSNDYMQLQRSAYKKAEIISSFLETLLDAVRRKLNEAEYYGTDSIWIGFQNKLENIAANYYEECKIRKTCLEKFKPESYKKIVAQMNELINRFRELDREYQAATPVLQTTRLIAYINQDGLLKKWEGLLRQGIHSLAVLLEKKEIAHHNPFHMGICD